MSRRGFLGAAATGIGVAALPNVVRSATEPGNTVNLGDEGLESGDSIDPYLDEFWQGGNKVVVPGGEYDYDSGIGIETDESAWLVGDGMVSLNGSPDDFNAYVDGSAHVRYQNLDFDEGEMGINSAATGDDATLEFVNVNIHGTGGDDAGMYWDNPHAGVGRLINCTIDGGFSDGVYASSFAEADDIDGHGTIEVYGGLFRNNNINQIRVGGDDSKVIGAVCVVDDTFYSDVNMRGIRVREAGENQVIHNCDVYMEDVDGAGLPIHVADTNFEGAGPSDVTVTDTRIYNEGGDTFISTRSDDFDISADNIHLTGGDNYELEGSGPFTNVYTGSDADSPQKTKRFVDPENPGDGSTSSGDTTEDSDEETTEPEHTLEIKTFADPRSGINYEFTTSAELVQLPEPESNDEIVQNDDGTWTATGTTGGGYSDTYGFDGEITAWSAETHPDEDSGEYALYLDGEEVDPAQFSEDSDEETTEPEHTLEIETFADPRSGILYEFTTSAELVQLPEPESNDEIVQNDDGTWTAEGTTGGGYADTFGFDGEITAWSAETHPEEDSGEYALYLDGEEVDPAQFSEESDDTTEQTRTLEIETYADPRSGILYEFTASSEIVQVPEPESNDEIVQNDDGTWTATGTTGGGYSDTYDVTGEITAWSAETHPDEDSGEYTLYLDGEEVDPSEFGDGSDDSEDTEESEPKPTQSFVITTFSDPTGGIDYEFTAAGEVVQPEAEANDSITANSDGSYTVTGSTDGGYADAYTVTGEITDWSAGAHPDEDDPSYTLYLGGQEVAPEDLGGSTTS